MRIYGRINKAWFTEKAKAEFESGRVPSVRIETGRDSNSPSAALKAVTSFGGRVVNTAVQTSSERMSNDVSSVSYRLYTFLAKLMSWSVEAGVPCDFLKDGVDVTARVMKHAMVHVAGFERSLSKLDSGNRSGKANDAGNKSKGNP